MLFPNFYNLLYDIVRTKQNNNGKNHQYFGQLYQKYKGKIELLVGGGITPSNIKDIAANAQSGQLHMTAKQTYYDDGNYVAVDRETLRKALKQLKG